MYNNPRWGRILLVAGGYSAFMVYLWYYSGIITEISISTILSIALLWLIVFIAWVVLTIALLLLSYPVRGLAGFLGFYVQKALMTDEPDGLCSAATVIIAVALVAAPVRIILDNPYTFPLLSGLIELIF